MTRFFTHLFDVRSSSARPMATSALHLEALETRISPSGIGTAIKAIAQSVMHQSASEAAYLSQHGITISGVTLLTVGNHMISLPRH